jgi:hypothetical protein
MAPASAKEAVRGRASSEQKAAARDQAHTLYHRAAHGRRVWLSSISSRPVASALNTRPVPMIPLSTLLLPRRPMTFLLLQGKSETCDTATRLVTPRPCLQDRSSALPVLSPEGVDPFAAGPNPQRSTITNTATKAVVVLDVGNKRQRKSSGDVKSEIGDEAFDFQTAAVDSFGSNQASPVNF